MRILALIPARGGSKRLPGKNIRLLNGLPLIAWSIKGVAGIPEICDILVSTDAQDIAEVARREGALVPWLRPAELSTDTATAAEVCLHALERYENERGSVDGLLLLQPTSPFRSRSSVARGIGLFQTHGRRRVIGLSPADSHPLWCFKVQGDGVSAFGESGTHLRSQDLPPAYVVNGAFYLVAPEDLRKSGSLFADNMVPLVMEAPHERVDIDTEWDWKMAELTARLLFNTPD